MRVRGWVLTGVVAAGAVVIGCSSYGDRLAPHVPSVDNTVRMGPGVSDPMDAAAAKQPSPLPPPPFFGGTKNGGPYHGSATIGPKGGMVVFGPHGLSVPAGALTVPTLITANSYGGDTLAVQFQPQGLTFLVPATLGLSYKHCKNVPDSGLYMVYVNNGLTTEFAMVPSQDHRFKDYLIGDIPHFSVYAAAEHKPPPPHHQ
jgi:hypothetical protein